MLFSDKLILILCMAARASGSTEWETLNKFRNSLDELSYEITTQFQNHELIYNRSLDTIDGTKTHFVPIFLDWVNILPEVCTSNVNETQINHYKQIIDLLLHQNVEPVLILYSGNLPQKFAPLGGWTNPIIVQYFANYARQAFKIFGDRVKTWITFHEPRLICETFDGLIGDEFPSGVTEYLCAHHILKAHAEAYQIYDKEYRIIQHGEVSITLDFRWMDPKDTFNLNDIRAAEQGMQFEFGLYANPLISIDYPSVVKNRVATRSTREGFEYSRLPTFTYAEKLRISGTYDFIALIYQGSVEITATEDDATTSPHIQRDFGGKISDGKKNEKKSEDRGCRNIFRWLLGTYNNYKINQNILFYK